MIGQLTRNERQSALLILVALAIVGLAMAAIGRADPIGSQGALAASTLHLSPAVRGRNASSDAFRVRGRAPSWDLNPSPGAARRPLPMGDVRLADELIQTNCVRM